MENKYRNLWLVFAQIEPSEGYDFSEIVSLSDLKDSSFQGAWANLIVNGENIQEVLRIVPLGLAEKKFDLVFIDKVENIQSLIEYEELNSNVIAEIDWLLESEFVFMISDKLFPYSD